MLCNRCKVNNIHRLCKFNNTYYGNHFTKCLYWFSVKTKMQLNVINTEFLLIYNCVIFTI